MSRRLLFPSPDDSLLDLHLHLSMDHFSPDDAYIHGGDDYIYGDDDNYLYGGEGDHGDYNDDWGSLEDLVLGGALSESPDLDFGLGLHVNLNLDAASLDEGVVPDSPATWIDAPASNEELLWEEEPDDLPVNEAAFDLDRGDAEADAHAWDVLVALDEIAEEMQELFFGAEEDGLGIGEVEFGDELVARAVVEGLPSVVVAEGEGAGESIIMFLSDDATDN